VAADNIQAAARKRPIRHPFLLHNSQASRRRQNPPRWQDEIERGEFSAPDEPDFASAALSYMKAGANAVSNSPD
jgi:hypothetical protein